MDGETKVKSVPIIQATFAPALPIPFACMIVAIPAARIEALITAVDVEYQNLKNLILLSGTTIIPPKAANIC